MIFHARHGHERQHKYPSTFQCHLYTALVNHHSDRPQKSRPPYSPPLLPLPLLSINSSPTTESFRSEWDILLPRTWEYAKIQMVRRPVESRHRSTMPPCSWPWGPVSKRVASHGWKARKSQSVRCRWRPRPRSRRRLYRSATHCFKNGWSHNKVQRGSPCGMMSTEYSSPPSTSTKNFNSSTTTSRRTWNKKKKGNFDYFIRRIQ